MDIRYQKWYWKILLKSQLHYFMEVRFMAKVYKQYGVIQKVGDDKPSYIKNDGKFDDEIEFEKYLQKTFEEEYNKNVAGNEEQYIKFAIVEANGDITKGELCDMHVGIDGLNPTWIVYEINGESKKCLIDDSNDEDGLEYLRSCYCKFNYEENDSIEFDGDYLEYASSYLDWIKQLLCAKTLKEFVKIFNEANPQYRQGLELSITIETFF